MAFVKGQSGNPKGRKPRAYEERYLKRVVRSMPADQWDEVLAKVATLAKRGERWAVEFFADRLMGKAVQPVNLDTPEKIIFEVVYADREDTDNPANTTQKAA